MSEMLYNRIGDFAISAFPDATSVEHLKKLKKEADEAIEDTMDITEYADCLIALLGAVYKSNFRYDELICAANSKLKINEQRTWIKLPDGTYQHVKHESV